MIAWPHDGSTGNYYFNTLKLNEEKVHLLAHLPTVEVRMPHIITAPSCHSWFFANKTCLKPKPTKLYFFWRYRLLNGIHEWEPGTVISYIFELAPSTRNEQQKNGPNRTWCLIQLGFFPLSLSLSISNRASCTCEWMNECTWHYNLSRYYIHLINRFINNADALLSFHISIYIHINGTWLHFYFFILD